MHATPHAEAPPPPLLTEASAAADRALGALMTQRPYLGAWDFTAAVLAVTAGASAFWHPALAATFGVAAAVVMLGKRRRNPLLEFGATCAQFVWANDIRRRAWEADDAGRDVESLRAEFEAMQQAYLFVPVGFKPLYEMRGVIFIAKRRLARLGRGGK